MSKQVSYGKLAKKLLNSTIEKDVKDIDQVFVTSFDKISSNAMNGLRGKLRGQNTRYRVAKNSILKRVVGNLPLKDIEGHIQGQCGLGISKGEISATSKIFTEFAKENEGFQVHGLYFEGAVYGPDKIKELATLPSREELLAKVCGQMNAPISGFVGVLSGLMRNFVSTLDQYKQKKENEKSS